MRSKSIFALILLILFSQFALAGTRQKTNSAKPQVASAVAQSPVLARKHFAQDVVQRAVALPQSDPQDRLQVLYSAITVAQSLSPKQAQQYADEGARIEAQLIASGQRPAVSVFETGAANCEVVKTFVESLAPNSVTLAEDSLIGALSACPAQVSEPERGLLERALQQGTLAPRALLALMEHSGPQTAWSQRQFSNLFSSLPDPEKFRDEAPNFAAMYSSMAPAVSRDNARDAGLHLLDWLSKLKEGA